MKRLDHKVEPFWRKSSLNEDREIISSLAERNGSSLFLGRFSKNEVRAVLRKRNFFKEAQKRNLWPLEYELDSRQYPLQRFRIFHRDKNPDSLIVDLKIRERQYPLGFHIEGFPAVVIPESLILEWLTLQNPLVAFTERETPLPGQAHPGLNLSKKIVDIFVDLAKLTQKDCLLAFPAYFHNAFLFSRYFHFVNPDKESEVFAIRKAFNGIPFKQLAWIIHLGCLMRGDGSAYEWKSEEQVCPLDRTLKEYFNSREYKERVKTGLKNLDFTINWACFRAKARDVPALCGSRENLV